MVHSTIPYYGLTPFLSSVSYSLGQSRSCSTDGGYLVYRATFTDSTTAILGATYQ